MIRLRAAAALIGTEVRDDVLIEIDEAGAIASVTPNCPPQPGAETVAGLVVPGLPNLHSHAFQRAMAGLAQRGGPGEEDFWAWREVMYRFVARLSPDDVEAIAAQIFLECLRHGYTSVAEFHYLHNVPDGRPYDDPAEMSHRIAAAAADAGVALRLLPVLYRFGGFGEMPATAGQRRFLLSPDAYASLVSRLDGDWGVAAHSLRAVAPADLLTAAALASGRPMHLHIAEQPREVSECLSWSGRRAVQWLLDHAPVDSSWCLVHATHIDPTETRAVAATGAIVGLCPSTEADLGDGVFPLPDYLAAEGIFGIGSDSNVCADPAAELRLLHGVQRLVTQNRNPTRVAEGRSIGTDILARAAAGGARALGRRAGVIAPDHLADLVALDTSHPALLAAGGADIIDAWIFGALGGTPVRDVMVAGRWIVREGAHPRQDRIVARFTDVMNRLVRT